MTPINRPEGIAQSMNRACHMSNYAEDIQKAPVIFFLGAGASVPLGMPTTITFWKNLKERPIEPYDAHQLLLELEKDLDANGGVDIEVVLEKLLDWETQAEQLAKHSVARNLTEVQESLANNIARKAHQAILSRVVDTYADVNPYDAAQLWSPVLEELWKLGIRTVPIFTTNYDTVIEQATLFSMDLLRDDGLSDEFDYKPETYRHIAPEGYLRLRDGFNLAHREFAHWDQWEFHGYNERPDDLTVTLFKMHGSVTWSFIPTLDDVAQVAEGIGDNEFERPADEVGLLPPGVGRDPLGRTTAVHYPYLSKALPEHELFSVPISYFRSCLMDCKLCVCIGSTFRDRDIFEAVVESAMYRKGFASKLNEQGEQEWIEPGEIRLPGRLGSNETDDLRILTVAPDPDHQILRKKISAYPRELPVEVIPFEATFGEDSAGLIFEKIKELIGD